MVKSKWFFIIKGCFKDCGSPNGYFVFCKDGSWTAGLTGAKKYRFICKDKIQVE
jgi:hypothetical protein